MQACCCCTGGESLAALSFILVFCALGTLMWFHYGLSVRLDALQKRFTNMEAQSKETPEALHDYHIQLKGLESNVTFFGQDLKRINTEILSLHDAVQKLKEESSGLRASIAAAPEIKSLPKDVVSITESVASLGSKISMLESTVQDLKQGQHQLVDSAREQKGEHQQLKGSLAGLSVQKETREDTQVLKSSLTEYLHQELVQIASAVDDLNSTFAGRLNHLDQEILDTNESLTWVTNDLSQLHMYIYQNISSLKSEVFSSSTGALLHQEAQRMIAEVLSNGSKVNLTDNSASWQEVLGHAHQVAQAYWALAKDMTVSDGTIPAEGLLSKARVNANMTAALQALNSSVINLSWRIERLESLHKVSTLNATFENGEAVSPLEDALVTDSPSGMKLSKSDVEGALLNSAPTVPPILQQQLGSKMSTTSPSSADKRQPSGLETIL